MLAAAAILRQPNAALAGPVTVPSRFNIGVFIRVRLRVAVSILSRIRLLDHPCIDIHQHLPKACTLSSYSECAASPLSSPEASAQTARAVRFSPTPQNASGAGDSI
jgi:hypothetical protein